ncbi:MAG: hypothetical protein AAF829_13365 [Pseudomonadota bacterium]
MSSPMGDTGPAKTFENRVNRVADARVPSEAYKSEVSVLPDWKRELASKSGIPVSIVLGLLAVLAVRLVLYHYTGTAMLSDEPDLTMAKETGAALILAATLFLIFPFGGGLKYKLAQAIAVVVAITGMHNLVHSAPGVFSLIFSPEWTAEVVETTKPASVLFRGETTVLSAGEKTIPTVRRLGG